MRPFVLRRVTASIGAALALTAPACRASPFECQTDKACGGGRCEPEGWCSFVDVDCPSGYRFGAHAATTVAGTCVPVTEETGTAAPMGQTTDSTGTPPSETTTVSDGAAVSATSPDSSDTTGQPASSDGVATTDTTTSGSTGSTVTVLGPLTIAEDLDDGAMADPLGRMLWWPSGEDDAGSGFFGEHPDAAYYVGYFRFALPDAIPSEATILDARLRLTATPFVTYAWDSMTRAVGVWLQASDDAPQVSGFAAFPAALGGGDTLAVSLVSDTALRWPEDGGLTWSVGVNESPNLAPLLQALIAQQGGLSAGAHVQLWLAAEPLLQAPGEVTYADFAGQTPGVAELELAFTRP